MSAFFDSVWIYVILGALLLIVVLMVTVFKKTSFMLKVKNFINTVKRDLKLIWAMKKKWTVIIYTILLWFCFYLYFYICFYAFDFTKDLGPLGGVDYICDGQHRSFGTGTRGDWHVAFYGHLLASDFGCS